MSTETNVKSVAPQPQNPKPKGEIRSVEFEANGENHIAEVDLKAYSTRAIREHNRSIRAGEKLEEEDDQEEAFSDAALKLALLGTVSCTAFETLEFDALLDENFELVSSFTRAVQTVVFPPLPTPKVEA